MTKKTSPLFHFIWLPRGALTDRLGLRHGVQTDDYIYIREAAMHIIVEENRKTKPQRDRDRGKKVHTRTLPKF